ncbi:MAG: enoyl-CoA hydratase/isomerase family protein [Proteobacteria bacterium]|nr:enoyl-CoA hydratase/isomerase family protein [Pseudomonadota bacterium]
MVPNLNHWSLEINEDNILWLTFNRKDSSVNSLNESTLREFDQILDRINEQSEIKALIISSGKKSGFIVGADISQFKSLSNAQEATELIREGQKIFNKLEQLKIPTIALIDGVCLGGGLELTLACNYRIAHDSPKTRLGLPEVKLGIQPGWGGTVRLPKLIGAKAAMEVILSGRTLSAKSAKKMGIIHEALPLRLLLKAARHYALASIDKPKFEWQKYTNYGLSRKILGNLIKQKLKQKVNPTHYPAPFKIIENWVENGITLPKAMDVEAESIGELLVSETSRNLVRVFFLQEQLKSLGKNIEYKPQHIHVIGAGVMGGDIAAWCAIKGFNVTLQDQGPHLIGNAVKRTYDLAMKQLKEKHLIQQVMDRLMPDPKGIGISKADIIIEAITEKLQAKQELFSMLEKSAKPQAILATNTSTIPLEEIGMVLDNPHRLIGIHFFNPVAKMPLVEIVRSQSTSQAEIDKAGAFVRRIDKLPLVVKSKPGFLVNRILFPYMLEAMSLLEEGVSPTIIDKAATEFGMPMGPIELADAVGLDICLAALEKLATSKDIVVPEKLKTCVAKGELGQKTGKGFYQYKKKRALKPKLLPTETIPNDIKDRLVIRLLNEAIACLREKIVSDADLLDAGCIFGFGFPPFRGGPLHYAHSHGLQTLLEQLKTLEARYGARFAPDKGWELGEQA